MGAQNFCLLFSADWLTKLQQLTRVLVSLASSRLTQNTPLKQLVHVFAAVACEQCVTLQSLLQNKKKKEMRKGGREKRNIVLRLARYKSLTLTHTPIKTTTENLNTV